MAGVERQALWREVGEWWTGERTREIERFIDESGVRREVVRELPMWYEPSGIVLPEGMKPNLEDHSEDWTLRVRRQRDEKMSGYETSVPSFKQGRSKSPPYVPLHTCSGYAFGLGMMLPQEMARLAAMAELPAMAIVDPFSLVGAVEFARECREVGVKPLIGASFELASALGDRLDPSKEVGGEIVLIAQNALGYRNLSRLITACHLEEPRQFPLATWERIERFAEGCLCMTGGDRGPVNRLLAARRDGAAMQVLERLVRLFGSERVFVEIDRAYLPWELSVNERLRGLAEALRLRMVASGLVTHARREFFPIQDVLTCSQSLCAIDEVVGRKPPRHPNQPGILPRPQRALNAERYLRTREEFAALYSGDPDLVLATLRIAEMVEEDVLPTRTRLPQLYENPEHVLREVCEAGMNARYAKPSAALRRRATWELERISRLGFAGHFLVAWDMCDWANRRGILFSGRGSVVDSVVAYCLGFSRIDAFEHKLHFDRFLPSDGLKRPDIDIDFEARHRDDVRNYLTRKYSADHVATVAAIGAFCTRGIVREVGKAFGLPDDVIKFLSKRLHGGISANNLEKALESRPELRGSGIPKERFKWVLALADRMMDVPRNMRAHTSGVVISERPIAETVPTMWSASEGDEDAHLRIMQWDKRSAKHYFDKFDVLCLRGQDVLSGTQRRLIVREEDFRVDKIPIDDPEPYAAMRSGELIGIPQSASPAMRQAHMRLKTRDLVDASLVQAGIRPGVGGAVKLNEMIARRHGKPFQHSHPDLQEILGHTYGIIVFQEQVDQLLQKFAGYSSGDAEDIRENIHKKRRQEFADEIRAEVLERIKQQGYPNEIASEVYDLVCGFNGYGFAQGHALAFAEISVRSIYCQQNYPSEYFASLLDAQPAGYYGPCTLVNEARTRGVRILPVDINQSRDEFRVEPVKSDEDPKIVFPSGGVRVSLRQISGLSKEAIQRTLIGQESGGYRSIFDYTAGVQPNRDELEALILCGAFDLLHPNRRQLLWAIPSIMEYGRAHGTPGSLPLDAPEPVLPDGVIDFNEAERAIHERRLLDLDVSKHLLSFERERISARGGLTSFEARHLEHGRKAVVVGNPIRLRFPPTPSGKRVVFFDLEDETGLLNVTCFDRVYQLDGHSIVCSPYVTVIGEAQVRDGHVAFLAQRVFPYRPHILNLLDAEESSSTRSADMGWGRAPLPVTTADFLVG